jgi:hypothetical protein
MQNAGCRMQDANSKKSAVGCVLCTVYCLTIFTLCLQSSISYLSLLTTKYVPGISYLFAACSMQQQQAAGSRERGVGRRSQVTVHIACTVHSAQCECECESHIVYSMPQGDYAVSSKMRQKLDVGCWI